MAFTIPTRHSPGSDARAELFPAGTGSTFLLVSVLFLLWGVPNNLNDVLIRQFMKSFAITRFEAGLVQSAFYLGYFLFALPAGLLIRKFGYKATMITGLLLFASGCMLFLPAAFVGRYSFFLVALFVLASGLSFLESSANPLIAQLGPTDSSERRLNIAQAFNPIGAILGAFTGTFFIFSGVEHTEAQTAALRASGDYAAYLHHETLRMVTPYLVLGTVALCWATLIAFQRFPAFLADRQAKAHTDGNWSVLLKERHFLLSLVAQFFYVGAQVGTWSYFIQYAEEYAHAPEKKAGLLLSGTLLAFGLGRFLSAYLMKNFLPSRLMFVYATINVVLLGVGIARPGWVGLLAILFTSFFMSIMFPTIFALGLKDLGPNTNVAGSALVMTIVGGAVLTPLMGLMAEHLHSTAAAYQLPLYCYLVVAAFALYMTRYTRERAQHSTFNV